MKKSTLDFWVGLFVLVGVIATVFIALRVANLTTTQHGSTYSLTAEFDNIGGLKPRAPVKSAGVKIGRVTDIALDADTHKALVTVELDARYHFSTDASMSILTAGLLGEQYIGIQTGADTETLGDGDSIWFTSSAIVLENLIGEIFVNKAKESGSPVAK